MRALGQEDIEDSEKPKGLVDFSVVKELVTKRVKAGKIRDVDLSLADGVVCVTQRNHMLSDISQVKKNLLKLQAANASAPISASKKPLKKTKSKKPVLNYGIQVNIHEVKYFISSVSFMARISYCLTHQKFILFFICVFS